MVVVTATSQSDTRGRPLGQNSRSHPPHARAPDVIRQSSRKRSDTSPAKAGPVDLAGEVEVYTAGNDLVH